MINNLPNDTKIDLCTFLDDCTLTKLSLTSKAWKQTVENEQIWLAKLVNVTSYKTDKRSAKSIYIELTDLFKKFASGKKNLLNSNGDLLYNSETLKLIILTPSLAESLTDNELSVIAKSNLEIATLILQNTKLMEKCSDITIRLIYARHPSLALDMLKLISKNSFIKSKIQNFMYSEIAASHPDAAKFILENQDLFSILDTDKNSDFFYYRIAASHLESAKLILQNEHLVNKLLQLRHDSHIADIAESHPESAKLISQNPMLLEILYQTLYKFGIQHLIKYATRNAEVANLILDNDKLALQFDSDGLYTIAKLSWFNKSLIPLRSILKHKMLATKFKRNQLMEFVKWNSDISKIILNTDEVVSIIERKDIVKLALMYPENALLIIQKPKLFDQITNPDIWKYVNFANAHPDALKLLLNKPELLTKLDEFNLMDIAEANLACAKFIMSHSDVFMKVTSRVLYRICIKQPEIAKIILQTPELNKKLDEDDYRYSFNELVKSSKLITQIDQHYASFYFKTNEFIDEWNYYSKLNLNSKEALINVFDNYAIERKSVLADQSRSIFLKMLFTAIFIFPLIFTIPLYRKAKKQYNEENAQLNVHEKEVIKPCRFSLAQKEIEYSNNRIEHKNTLTKTRRSSLTSTTSVEKCIIFSYSSSRIVGSDNKTLNSTSENVVLGSGLTC